MNRPFVALLSASALLVTCAQPDPVRRDTVRKPAPRAPVLGSLDAPIDIVDSPFVDRRDTQTYENVLSTYGCAPDKDLSGGEVVYRLDLATASLVSVEVDDVPGDEVDIDLHLLTDLDEAACQKRHNTALYEMLAPGRYYLVADTFVDGAGAVKAGLFNLSVRISPMPEDACEMRRVALPMRWQECAPGIDCEAVEGAGDGVVHTLQTPAVGPVVMEAHLVTDEDDFGQRGWPNHGEHEIDRHRARTLEQIGANFALNQPWAPAGEGGSRWGQGSTGRPVPVDAEAWYITMNWAERPDPGTRMIVVNPANGRAVVAAAGYETGPGSPTAVAGVSEEIHRHLGTTHRATLMVGFAVDPSLPFGPVVCAE